VEGIEVKLEHVETNMVFAKLADEFNIENIAEDLKQKNILISTGNPLRLVTHLDIDKNDIDTFILELKKSL